MKKTLALVALVLLAPPALAETNIWGIPGECQLEVVECATGREAAKRPAPRVLSSVYMQDSWTVHAYEPSPDGKTLLVMLEDGLRLVRGGRTDDYRLDLHMGPREFAWHPDSRRVAFWVRDTPPAAPGQPQTACKALAVLDVTALPPAPLPQGAKVPYEVVHWSSKDSVPFGHLWSPDGEALLVIATDLDPANATSGVLRRVPTTGPARDLLRLPGDLDFVYGPRGSVVPAGQDRVLVAHAGVGLCALGGLLQPIPDLPPSGLFNLAWSPDWGRNHVLLFYRKSVQGRSGQVYRGVYLLELEAALGESARPAEQLHDQTDVHSLSFSPLGTYATWAGPGRVAYRPVDGKPSDTVEVRSLVLESGEDLWIKGMAWSPDETKLAITAGNRLYVHEPATKELYLVAELGKLDHTFLAQPTWVGDRVIVGSYEDTQRSGRKQPPVQPVPPAGGDEDEPWAPTPPQKG